jgi:hypothetical protein
LQIALLAVCLVALPQQNATAQDASTSAKEQGASDDAPKRASRASAGRKGKAAAAKRKKARVRKARKRRRARARKARGRAAQRKKRVNRPKGWQWPPTPAMRAQGKACLKTLTGLGVPWKKAGRRKGIATPIRVPSLAFNEIELAPTFRKPPFVMDCHLAVALAKAAPAMESAGVSELRFSSIYSYRKAKVNGIVKEALSRHSYGLAIDVYEVRDDLGEIFVVEDQYLDEEVIRKLENVLNETGLFRLVLSPANDPQSHSDHLHLEARISVGAKKRVAKRRNKKRVARKRRRR